MPLNPNRKGRDNFDKKNSQNLKRTQYRAHYNLHKRLRDAEEERKMKSRIDNGEFAIDLDESPLARPEVVADATHSSAKTKKGDQ